VSPYMLSKSPENKLLSLPTETATCSSFHYYASANGLSQLHLLFF
jgi:hypothetical protein